MGCPCIIVFRRNIDGWWNTKMSCLSICRSNMGIMDSAKYNTKTWVFVVMQWLTEVLWEQMNGGFWIHTTWIHLLVLFFIEFVDKMQYKFFFPLLTFYNKYWKYALVLCSSKCQQTIQTLLLLITCSKYSQQRKQKKKTELQVDFHCCHWKTNFLK